jgi:hypothetical protein
MIVGTGRYKYRVNADWAKLPEGFLTDDGGHFVRNVTLDGKVHLRYRGRDALRLGTDDCRSHTRRYRHR